jgi:hypothetical protein
MEAAVEREDRRFEAFYSKAMHPYVVYTPAVALISLDGTTSFLDWFTWMAITLFLLYFFSSGYVYMRMRTMRRPDGGRIHSREFFRERTGEMVVPSLLFIAPAVLGLYFLNGPTSLLALVLAVGGAMLIVVLINFYYRASLHLSSTTSIMTTLGITFGVICLAVLPFVLLLGYARYRLRAHTIPQMIAGSAIGIGCAFAAFYGLGV